MPDSPFSFLVQAHDEPPFCFPETSTASQLPSTPRFAGHAPPLSTYTMLGNRPRNQEGPSDYLSTPLWSPTEQLDTSNLTSSDVQEFPAYHPSQTPTVPPPADYGLYELHGDHQALGGSFTAALPVSALDSQYTGITPLFANFGTDSPTSNTSPYSGPLRGWSNTAPSARRRSGVLLNTSGLPSASGLSPATPHSSHSAYTAYFPYPTPRSSSSSRPSYSVPPGIPLRRRATTGPVNALQMTPRMPVPKRIHPSPISASPLHRLGAQMDVRHVSDQFYGGMGVEISAGYRGPRMGQPPLVEAKPARFKPTKEQLAILIASYNENKWVVLGSSYRAKLTFRNPDAHTRDRLVKQLGGGVKAKTLQIWFQNR